MLITIIGCTQISPISRPSRVFQDLQEKSERPGRSGDVIRLHGCVSPPTRPRNGHDGHMTKWVSEWAEIRNCASNCVRLHHQIDQAFLIFLAYVEKHGKAWVQRGYGSLVYIWERYVLGKSDGNSLTYSMQVALDLSCTLLMGRWLGSVVG